MVNETTAVLHGMISLTPRCRCVLKVHSTGSGPAVRVPNILSGPFSSPIKGLQYILFPN